MNSEIRNVAPSLLVTLLILVVLEIVSSTILPILGLQHYRPPFNILIILFLGFKLETPILGVLILCVQYFHSFFSIEGWASGTIAGVIVCTVIAYLRDVIHFSSAWVTAAVTQIFQVVWFFITGMFLYFQGAGLGPILDKFWRFIPESLLLSLLSPAFFAVLDRVWKGQESGLSEDAG